MVYRVKKFFEKEFFFSHFDQIVNKSGLEGLIHALQITQVTDLIGHHLSDHIIWSILAPKLVTQLSGLIVPCDLVINSIKSGVIFSDGLV